MLKEADYSGIRLNIPKRLAYKLEGYIFIQKRKNRKIKNKIICKTSFILEAIEEKLNKETAK